MKKNANRNTCTSSKFFLVRTYDILDIIRPIVIVVVVLLFLVFFCCSQRPLPFSNLVPRALCLASRENPGCGWSRGSQNLGAKIKGGEEE